MFFIFLPPHIFKNNFSQPANGTFGFARPTSRPFTKPKEPFFSIAQTNNTYLCVLTMTRFFHIIFFTLIGFILTPTDTYACGSKSNETELSNKKSDKVSLQKNDCCDKEKGQCGKHGKDCDGKCGNPACHCPTNCTNNSFFCSNFSSKQ